MTILGTQQTPRPALRNNRAFDMRSVLGSGLRCVGLGCGADRRGEEPGVGHADQAVGGSMVVNIRPLPVMTPSKGPPIAPLLILTR